MSSTVKQAVLASGNAGKLKEFSQHLSPLNITLMPQSLYVSEEVEETGLSFVENAILKARHASQASGMPALADDSGLEVLALQGAPGIYSARYAGYGATRQDRDLANNTQLLQALAQVPDHDRKARFVCALVWVRHANDPVPLICQGFWEGHILKQPQGTGGFGYDPLFIGNEFIGNEFIGNEFIGNEFIGNEFMDKDNKVSAAMLTPKQKMAVSHRGKALQQILQKLPDHLNIR